MPDEHHATMQPSEKRLLDALQGTDGKWVWRHELGITQSYYSEGIRHLKERGLVETREIPSPDRRRPRIEVRLKIPQEASP